MTAKSQDAAEPRALTWVVCDSKYLPFMPPSRGLTLISFHLGNSLHLFISLNLFLIPSLPTSVSWQKEPWALSMVENPMPGHRERYTQPPRGQQQTFKVERKQRQSQHNHSGGSRDGPAPAPAPIPAGGCPGLTANSSSWLLSCTLLAKPDGVQCLPPALSIF